jgi:hypothetical protein
MLFPLQNSPPSPLQRSPPATDYYTCLFTSIRLDPTFEVRVDRWGLGEGTKKQLLVKGKLLVW